MNAGGEGEHDGNGGAKFCVRRDMPLSRQWLLNVA